MEAIFIQAINRLEAVLAGEINALQNGVPANFGDLSTRKHQSLLELSRIAKGLERLPPSDALKIRLATLKSRLEENQRVVHLHLEATREVSSIITKTLRDAESDGTYTAAVPGVAGAR